MATDSGNTIPFSLAHDQSVFRLIELPDELLQLLTSDNPPLLQIKSGPTASSSAAAGASSAFAVLCTANKTFNIRQVQTSNSLYVVQPCTTGSAAKENASSTSLGSGMCAIATCPATLELSIAVRDASAESYLKKLLVEWEDEHKPMLVDNKSIQAVFADVPLSDAEIRPAWRTLCAFELEDTAYRPSSRLLLLAWKAIMSAAAVEKGGFESVSLLPSFWHGVAEEEGLPKELFEAIRSRVHADEADAPKETAAWLALIILDCAKNGAMDRSSFLESWKDILPENWRSHATLDLVKAMTDQTDPTTISLITHAIVKTDETTTTAPSASARKWHERFKKGR